MTSSNRLQRSGTNKMLSGVSGGLAEYFDVDPVLVRVGWVVLCLVTAGVAILLYIAMVIIMPTDDAGDTGSSDDAEDGLVGSTDDVSEPAPRARANRERRRSVMALLLIVLGALILVSNFGWLWWISIGTLWPVVLIGVGLVILFGRSKRS